MNTPIRKILVPLDFTGTFTSALEYAGELAKPWGAKITVLHVVDIPTQLLADVNLGVDQNPSIQKRAVDDASTRLHAIMDENKHVDVQAAHTRTGPVAEGILQEVRDHEYDLVVIGTHAERDAAMFGLGTVAEKVVRSAECPVITVRSNVENMKATRVLVPVDLAIDARPALSLCAEIARAFDAAIDVLHVVADPGDTTVDRWTGILGINRGELAERAQVVAQSRIEDLVKNWGADFTKVETFVRYGDVAEQILAHIEERGCDAIVLPTHGRQGIAHAILGSQAERILRSAKCPVATVKSQRDPAA